MVVVSRNTGSAPLIGSNPGSRVPTDLFGVNRGLGSKVRCTKSDANCVRSEADRTSDGVKKRLNWAVRLIVDWVGRIGGGLSLPALAADSAVRAVIAPNTPPEAVSTWALAAFQRLNPDRSKTAKSPIS